MKIRRLFPVCLALSIFFHALTPVHAAMLMTSPGGHAAAGPNAVHAALPPPRDYLNLSFANYHFDRSKNNNGNKAMSPTFDLNMTSLRFIKMFPDGLFGGVSGFNVAASMAHIEVNNMPGGGKGNFRTTLGDPNFELMQAWDFDKWWLHIRLGGYAGIGDYVKNNAANWSKDYWSFYPQVRGTVWLDKEKIWSYSLMATYEIPTKMRSYNVTPGHHLVVESSIAHNVNEYFALAASGYYIRETTAASGSDVGWNRHQKYSVWGAGPYAMVFLPWLKEGALIHLAYWTEFAARNRSQGGMFFTELNVPF